MLCYLTHPYCGVLWVVDHVHVDHVHRGLLLCLPLGEVLQCLIVHLRIVCGGTLWKNLCHLLLHCQYYIKLLFTLLESLGTRLARLKLYGVECAEQSAP